MAAICAAIRDHLGYLHTRVTALWLTPVWKNTDSDYHGYHATILRLDDTWIHAGIPALVAEAHKLA